MKIIEGKQAVLHPYRTSVTNVPRRISDSEMRRPVEVNISRVTDADLQKPVYGTPRKATESVGMVFPMETRTPVDCTLQTASERTLQPVRAQVDPVSPEWGQMWNENTNGMSGRKKRKWLADLADNIMHMTDMK